MMLQSIRRSALFGSTFSALNIIICNLAPGLLNFFHAQLRHSVEHEILNAHKYKKKGQEALNRSPEYTGQQSNILL